MAGAAPIGRGIRKSSGTSTPSLANSSSAARSACHRGSGRVGQEPQPARERGVAAPDGSAGPGTRTGVPDGGRSPPVRCAAALAHNARVDRQIEALVLNWILEQRGSFLAEHQRLLSTNESWRRATAGRRAWGAWIALHDALPAGDPSFLSIPSTPVRRVWFLDPGACESGAPGSTSASTLSTASSPGAAGQLVRCPPSSGGSTRSVWPTLRSSPAPATCTPGCSGEACGAGAGPRDAAVAGLHLHRGAAGLHHRDP